MNHLKILLNVQNPEGQGGLTAFLCIHAFPLATCLPRCELTTHYNKMEKVRGHVLYD